MDDASGLKIAATLSKRQDLPRWPVLTYVSARFEWLKTVRAVCGVAFEVRQNRVAGFIQPVVLSRVLQGEGFVHGVETASPFEWSIWSLAGIDHPSRRIGCWFREFALAGRDVLADL